MPPRPASTSAHLEPALRPRTPLDAACARACVETYVVQQIASLPCMCAYMRATHHPPRLMYSSRIALRACCVPSRERSASAAPARRVMLPRAKDML